jgi:ribosomal protein S18 acetylase RimI-like enzyme
MDLSLRRAENADAILIADLSRQTFQETFSADNTPENMHKFLGEQFTRGKLILEVGDPQLQFFLAFEGAEPAGYVKLRDGKRPLSLGKTDALEIARLYAVKSMVGKGVGRLLMQKSLDVASEMGKEVVWLGVWERNQRAIDFYHRWGFKKFDEQDFLLGNDVQRDWLMKKGLG